MKPMPFGPPPMRMLQLCAPKTSPQAELTVQDGAHTINIALLGNYLSSTFVASNDGHGGTSVIDPPANQSNPLISLNTQNAHA